MPETEILGRLVKNNTGILSYLMTTKAFHVWSEGWSKLMKVTSGIKDQEQKTLLIYFA